MNDWQYYSYVLGKAFIENIEEPLFKGLSSEIQFNYKNERNYEVVLKYLNNLDGIKGFFL